MIAQYGTKVGALTGSGSEPICLDLTQSDDCSSATADTAGAADGAECDIEHATWWSQIRAGSLVDAKDLQGVWYQVHQQNRQLLLLFLISMLFPLSADRLVPFHVEFEAQFF